MAKAYTSRLSNESFEAVESKLGGLGEESDKTSPNVEAFLCSDRKERKFTKEGFERFSASLMFPDSIPNTEVGFPTLELGKAKRMFGDVLSLVAGRPGAEVSLYHSVVRERYQIPFAGICEKAPIEFTGPIPVLVFRVINDFDGEKTGRFVALTGTQFEEGWDLEFLEGCRMAFKRLAEGTSVSLSTPVEGLGCDTRSFAMEFTSQDLEEPELINRCFEEFVPVFGEVSESVHTAAYLP